MLKNSVVRYATLGSALREIQITTCNYFLPALYLAAFPKYVSQFMLLSCTTQPLCGLLSISLGGIIADKFGVNNPKVYPKICLISQILAYPFMMVSLLSGNFWLAMLTYHIRVLIGYAFRSPNVSIIQRTCPKEMLPSVLSSYQLLNMFSAFMAATLFAGAQTIFGISTKTPVLLGRLLAGFASFSMLGSMVAWKKASDKIT